MTVLRRNGKLPQKCPKSFPNLDFSAFASVCGFFFLQKYCLSYGIRILQSERAINLVTRETSLYSADSYTVWSGTGNYHTFAFSA